MSRSAAYYVGLLGSKYASGGPPLRAVEVSAEGEGVAGPEWVDGPALSEPVFEGLSVDGPLHPENTEFVEGFGYGRRCQYSIMSPAQPTLERWHGETDPARVAASWPCPRKHLQVTLGGDVRLRSFS